MSKRPRTVRKYSMNQSLELGSKSWVSNVSTHNSLLCHDGYELPASCVHLSLALARRIDAPESITHPPMDHTTSRTNAWSVDLAKHIQEGPDGLWKGSTHNIQHPISTVEVVAVVNVRVSKSVVAGRFTLTCRRISSDPMTTVTDVILMWNWHI